jgi:ATP-dependent helicase/nuclease subunit A
VQAARQLALRDAEDEYRRLLYVAMTRAADRLIVCGAEGVRGRPSGCWYDLVREPLSELLAEEKDDDGETVWRYRKSASTDAPRPSPEKPEAKSERPALPRWLRELAPAEPPRPDVHSPSSADDENDGALVSTKSSAADRQKALERGRIVHRLMQSLPDIVAERRKEAAERYCAKAAANFSAQEQTAMVQQTLGILGDKSFAEIFAAGSRAELPIVGRFARDGAPPIHVSGQIDRLAVSDDTVLIADYKTDRVPPKALGEVKAYVTQLALYRAVLARLYPGKTVRAALLFTEGPLLMEVPAAAMDQAYTALMAKPHLPVKVP